MAQSRSTKIISMIKWIRTSRLSIKNSLSLRYHSAAILVLFARIAGRCFLTFCVLSKCVKGGVPQVRYPFTPSQAKVDVRLPGKGNSNSHGPRPVHLIITMMKWIRTSRLSIKNSLSQASAMAYLVALFELSTGVFWVPSKS